MRIALFQPDIPQNTGSVMRLGACLGVGVDIIEPCGFLMDDKHLRRAGMDYMDMAVVTRHRSWTAFLEARGAARLVLATTRGSTPLPQFVFQPDDIILMGRESSGVPEEVHQMADARVLIPMQAGARSLNMAMSAAIIVAEGLRQIAGFPPVLAG